MGGEKQFYIDTELKKSNDNSQRKVHWLVMEDVHSRSDSESNESTIEDSADSETSCSSSSDIIEDASSSSSSSPPYGPLFDLSEIMAQLPIKRGLSKYYQGKSQSFGTLANVKSLEDLAKKGNAYSRRMKSCKSYAGGLDGHRIGPKATIAKKSCRGPLFSPLGSRNTIHMQKNI